MCTAPTSHVATDYDQITHDDKGDKPWLMPTNQVNHPYLRLRPQAKWHTPKPIA